MKGDITKCDCGHDAISNGFSTGYGEMPDGKKYCFACCGERDKAEMIETGKATLYLNHKRGDSGGTVSNWPGTLKINAYIRNGRHNMARHRYDAWFTGPDGKQWHGVTIGDNTQICRCKRLKHA